MSQASLDTPAKRLAATPIADWHQADVIAFLRSPGDSAVSVLCKVYGLSSSNATKIRDAGKAAIERLELQPDCRNAHK
jgi:hypothetical protein